MPKYRFSENPSEGTWRLGPKGYTNLLAAGWFYTPDEYDLENGWDTKPFSAGDTVPYGWRRHLTGEFDSLQDAVESWEQATGQDVFAEGCNCCGAPFSIHEEGGSNYISGDSVERVPVRPW